MFVYSLKGKNETESHWEGCHDGRFIILWDTWLIADYRVIH